MVNNVHFTCHSGKPPDRILDVWYSLVWFFKIHKVRITLTQKRTGEYDIYKEFYLLVLDNDTERPASKQKNKRILHLCIIKRNLTQNQMPSVLNHTPLVLEINR